ncbi:MAG: cell division protein ZapA [Eubacteriaceae bacterium]|nr:cell division protein ZapA [Eubacteriaceae bacterium]
MEIKNKVVARVQGSEYSLMGSITQDHMDEICETINDMVREVTRSNPLMNKNVALMLCALNLSDELKKQSDRNDELQDQLGNIESINELKEQIRIYKEYANRNNEIYQELSMENDKLKEEIEASKETIEQYNKKIRQYKHDIEESRRTILNLQNQLFESQIELVKANKKSGYGEE